MSEVEYAVQIEHLETDIGEAVRVSIRQKHASGTWGSVFRHGRPLSWRLKQGVQESQADFEKRVTTHARWELERVRSSANLKRERDRVWSKIAARQTTQRSEELLRDAETQIDRGERILALNSGGGDDYDCTHLVAPSGVTQAQVEAWYGEWKEWYTTEYTPSIRRGEPISWISFEDCLLWRGFRHPEGDDWFVLDLY